MRGKAIDWLHYIQDTERIYVTLWSNIGRHFKAHYDTQVQTVHKVCNFAKLKHEEWDDLADLKLKVSKLINNVSSRAPDYWLVIREAYTFAEDQQITLKATQNLKTLLMETLFINKLAPNFKDYMLSQEPESLNANTNTAKAMWKRKLSHRQNILKLQNISIIPITTDIEESLNSVPDDIRKECIMAI